MPVLGLPNILFGKGAASKLADKNSGEFKSCNSVTQIWRWDELVGTEGKTGRYVHTAGRFNWDASKIPECWDHLRAASPSQNGY